MVLLLAVGGGGCHVSALSMPGFIASTRSRIHSSCATLIAAVVGEGGVEVGRNDSSWSCSRVVYSSIMVGKMLGCCSDRAARVYHRASSEGSSKAICKSVTALFMITQRWRMVAGRGSQGMGFVGQQEGQ